MGNAVEIRKQYTFRSTILVNGEEVGCIDRAGGATYVLVKKTPDQPFHWFNNAQSIARWKYGRGRTAGARAWAKKVFSAMTVADTLEKLKTTSPLGLFETL